MGTETVHFSKFRTAIGENQWEERSAENSHILREAKGLKAQKQTNPFQYQGEHEHIIKCRLCNNTKWTALTLTRKKSTKHTRGSATKSGAVRNGQKKRQAL